MLGSHSFELGPLNIPIWLVTALAGYFVALVVERFLLKRHKIFFTLANDLLTTGVVVALVVWKLFPLATRFREIAASPARLIYYPGGGIGLIAGVVIATVVMIAMITSRRRRGDEAAGSIARLGLAAAITAGFIVLPLTVVSVIPMRSNVELPAIDATLLLPEGEVTPVFNPSDPRPTVLVFWATWCGPCTAQMPEIQRFSESSGTAVRIFAVNLTATERGRETVASYMDENGYTIPVILDSRDALRRSLGVRATPTTVIFDAAGNERTRRTGAVTSAWIERRVLPLL